MLVDSYGLLSLAYDRRVGGRRPGSPRRQPGHRRARGRRDRPHAHPGAAVERVPLVRPGTTIAIVILLVLILGAAVAQFVLRLGP